MNRSAFSRRGVIGAGAASLSGLLLAGCDRLSNSPKFQSFVGSAEDLTFPAQRALLAGQPLARVFPASMLSPVFKSNGTSMPDSPAYKALLDNEFADYSLAVGGLVRQPMRFSLAELKALASRTQITRHDCVEGWSAIGQWTGVQLSKVLAKVGLAPDARYVVFYCADDMSGSTDGSGQYYESIDLFDAFHPQTILAYALNGKPLDAAHGAPLRLRVERQLGYKMAKYVMHIQVVDTVHNIKGGKGGYWEDQGYEWYAGI